MPRENPFQESVLPNKRVQRTRSATLRSPLTRGPLGSLGPVNGLGSVSLSVRGVPSNR
jgi:hypothetical protein